MTLQQLQAFVRRHGIVLESARGPVPSLAETVAGVPIKGHWWSHRDSHKIFAATRQLRGSPDILVCRLIDGKVTYVHRRLWPALVRLAAEVGNDRLAAITETHTAQGHRVQLTRFPEWVPAEVIASADAIEESDARRQLAVVLPGATARRRSKPLR